MFRFKFLSAFTALLFVAAVTSCGSSASAQPTSFVSASVSLNFNEKRMLDMLVIFADSQSAPIRLTSWIKGTLADSSEAHLLNREAGYDIECIEFISDGKSHYANVTIGELSVFSESEVKAIINNPARYLNSPEVHSQDSIQRINTALESCTDK